MSSDRRSTDADFDVVASALEEGLNSCRSVVKNYRAMLERGVEGAREDRVDGSACDLKNIDQMSDAGSGPGVDKP